MRMIRLRQAVFATVVLWNMSFAHAAAPVAPMPPAAYALPTGAVYVSNGAQLATQLAKTTPQKIILRNGTYSRSGSFYIRCGHKIYAETLNGAVLTSGIEIGTNQACAGGAVIQGVKINITVASNAIIPFSPWTPNDTSAIEIWGNAGKTSVLDVTIQGNNVVGTAIAARVPNGLKIARVIANGRFRSNGIYADADDTSPMFSIKPILEDIKVNDVSRPVPKSADGTAEACFWVGYPAAVNRIAVSNCAWMGVWTGTAMKDSTLNNIRVTNTLHGVYAEHYTGDGFDPATKAPSVIFQNMDVGPGIGSCPFICEWAAPEWGNKPACNGVVVQDSILRGSQVGAYLDDGTINTTVRRTQFIGQKRGAIALFNKHVNTPFDTTGNNYSGMQPGAVPILTGINNPCDP